MRIQERITIAASPADVWQALADPVAISRTTGGRMTVEPETSGGSPDLGSRYRVLVKLGAAHVGGLVEIVEFNPPREFSWVSLTGVSHRLRLRVRPADGGSTITVRFAYDAPGALGALADVVAFRANRSLVSDMLAAARHTIEHGTPPPLPSESVIHRAVREIGNAAVLARAGVIAPIRADKLLRIGLAARSWGPTLATAVAVGAVRHPDRVMIDDERGTLTYRAVDRRTNAIAAGLAELGLTERDPVGLMARNHRGFIEAILAVAKLGADALLLNTAFSGPQLAEVCAHEQPTTLIYDDEFTTLLADAAAGRRSVIAKATGSAMVDGTGVPSLDELAVTHDGQQPRPPKRTGRITILTSGTTGTPKGAARDMALKGAIPSLDAPAGMLARIPLRNGMRIGLPAPMFHAWGFSNFAIGLSLGATYVLVDTFDPEVWLEAIETKRVQALIVVPVMMQRMLQLPTDQRGRYDTSTLRLVSASGSALPGDLAARWMDAFGDTLYNLYGSTEVAAATIAIPDDMRAAPGTAGRPTRGTIVKVLDDDGYEVLQGATGRIFVGSSALFDGYTGGGDKQRIGGLMSTGDVGRFDESGRLFVQGRDDEMIVSGGENVFPKEIEDLLARHPAVTEAAAIGVEDRDFGERLKAFVALVDGAAVTEDELKAYVRDHLARYKVPRTIVFVDSLPRNATGKVLKRELSDRR